MIEHNPPPAYPEDYKFLAKIFNSDQSFLVSCKIFLPKSIIESPKIYLFPNRNLFNKLHRLKGKCNLSASLDEPHALEIICEDVHISSGSMRYWKEGLEEGYLQIYPTRLIIQHFVQRSEKNILWFWVTPSIHLAPSDLREYHYDGSVAINHGERFQFSLTEELSVIFFNYYHWKHVNKKETITFSELIAEIQLNRQCSINDIDNYLSIIDDFLLLVSLAEGHRCIIPKINIFLNSKYIEIYRCNLYFPNISQNHSANNFLIASSDLEDFLNKSWKVFTRSKYRQLLKQALAININDTPVTIESRFLSLFSSIETLLLVFRLENNLEFIFDKTIWKKLQKELKQIIKKNVDDENIKPLIYQNLNGLNRIPLQYVFKKFLEIKKINLNDLWPFLASESDYSLTKMRNRLVHGYGLSPNFIEPFSIALDNLECYAKCLLLISLGWDFNRSRLFWNNSFIHSWQKAITILKNWE